MGVLFSYLFFIFPQSLHITGFQILSLYPVEFLSVDQSNRLVQRHPFHNCPAVQFRFRKTVVSGSTAGSDNKVMIYLCVV